MKNLLQCKNLLCQVEGLLPSRFLLMTIIGFFTPILNAVDGHVLNKTNNTNNNQTKLRYYKSKDLLYILSVVSIPYLFIVIMVILLHGTNYIINRIFMHINKNKKKIQDKDKNSNTQLNILSVS